MLSISECSDFESYLPADARDVLARWASARKSDDVPDTDAFAPFFIPVKYIPWTMTYHHEPNGDLTYGVVGQKLVGLFGENSRGKIVLHYASPEDRNERYALINSSLKLGLPFWYTGDVLFKDYKNSFGRLGLPTSRNTMPVLVLIYFPFSRHDDDEEKMLSVGKVMQPLLLRLFQGESDHR